MEIPSFFETKIALTPRDMGRDITNLDSLIEEKIKTQFEGKCSRNGYVVPNSVKLISRSMGMVEKGRFTGDILFYTEAEARVLQPPDGVIIEGEVIRKNKMGIYVNYKDAIRVMIPRDLHIGDNDFDAIQVGETVEVEIKKSRYQVNDTSILSVGMYRSRKAGVPAAVPAAAKPAADPAKKKFSFKKTAPKSAAVAAAELATKLAKGGAADSEDDDEDDEVIDE
jgi:DNA-directed RNA polymerase subunit E'/Rpb7